MALRLNIGYSTGPNSFLAATGKYGILLPPALISASGGTATGARYRSGWLTATIPKTCTASIGQDSGTVTNPWPGAGKIDYANGSIPGGKDGKRGGRDPAVDGPTLIVGGTQLVQGIIQRYTHRELEPTAGNYVFKRMDADMAQCIALGVWLWPMFISKTFDSTNPVPDFMSAYVDPVNGGGTMERRWDLNNVAPVIRAVLTEIGQRYDGVPNFGGIATQETAAGGATNYTIDHYLSALKLEADAINAATPNSRHLAYQNFFPAPPGGDQSSPYSDRYVDLYAAYIQRYGAILAGPDLVVGGGVVSRCYNRYHAYRNGGTITRTSPNTGVLPTVTFFGTGPTSLALQNDEYDFTGKGAVPSATAIADAFAYGRGGSGSVLKIDFCAVDHHENNPGNPNSQQWATSSPAGRAAIDMIKANAAPFSGIWTPP